MSEEWVKQQEKRFAADSVVAEALENPIQRERIDVAVKFVGGPGLKVLDVGCGDGGISELIHNNGNECWGMDLPAVADTVPEERKEWFKVEPGDASLKPWGRIADGRPFKTEGSFESGFFDVVFAGEIIEHMLDLEPFFGEAWRVLKPGGRLVLTTPNVVRTLNRIAMLFGQVHTWHEWQRIPHHVRYFTPQTLKEAVVKHGFRPLRWGYGRSQAEGAEIGFDDSWLLQLSPQERAMLTGLVLRFSPDPVWQHSFIILDCQKVEVKSSGNG